MKTILISIVILGAIGAGVLVYLTAQKPTPGIGTGNDEVRQQAVSSSDEREEEMTKEVSRYVEYTKANWESSKSTRRILFFYANWCPTCRPADLSFSQNNSKIPVDVTVIRVNYNDTETEQDEKDLAGKYGVTYQHTFVQIDESDNAITKWNGGQIDELVQRIK